MRLENLEARLVMAGGPQLLAIRPSANDLLEPSDVLSVAPDELRFVFDEGQTISSATLDGIRFTRTGGDEGFEFAETVSDLGTGGLVSILFRSTVPGASGNKVILSFTQSDFGGAGTPIVTVTGTEVRVELNRNPDNLSSASDLLLALGNHPEASALLTASILDGQGTTPIVEPGRSISDVLLQGANVPRVRSDFGTAGKVRIEFLAQQEGPQNDISVAVLRADLGVNGSPQVAVVGRQVRVTLNTNPQRLSTAGELVGVVNANPQASSLLRAILQSGPSTEDIASSSASVGTLNLVGGSDITLVPGFVGVDPDRPHEVIVRFATRLPDDRYSIDIFGAGDDALTNTADEPFNMGRDQRLEFELDRGAQVIAVVPQPIDRAANGALSQRRNVIEVYFNDDDLTPASAQNPAFYRLIKTNESVSNTDDTVYLPTQVVYDANRDMATLTYGNDLSQLPGGLGTYRLRIGTNEALPPVPVARQGLAARTLELNTTNGTVPITFRAIEDFVRVQTVQLNASDFGIPGLPRVTVNGDRISILLNTHAGSESTPRQVAQAISQSISARLKIAVSANNADLDKPIAAAIATAPQTLQITGIGSSFSTATNVGTLTNQNLIYREEIGAQLNPLAYPGSNADPGHRDLFFEPHLQLYADAADKVRGVSTITYNFRDIYGSDPSGNPLHNVITENQKQRTREIFDLWSAATGVQFVEIDESQIPATIEAGLGTLTIVTGDIRALVPGASTGPNDGVIFTFGRILDSALNVTIPTLIVDNAETWGDGFAGSWMETAMRGIGNLLALGDGNELPNATVMQQVRIDGVERVIPSDHDIAHMQHVFRPEANDIDMYRFHLTNSGRLSAEIVAERLLSPSLLDATLTLYRQNSDGTRELIARNDDYFSEDAFLELDLKPGTYFIAVTSTGNNVIDPTMEGSGGGGTTQGKYELRLNFRGEANQGIVDLTGTQLDGDADGIAGGVYNFWFKSQSVGDTIIVDKSAAAGGTGTLAAPFNNIPAAFAAAGIGDIVRIVGNGGADRNLSTLADNLPYQIGRDALGNPLIDGAIMAVPKGVTVMIDAGAIFKSRLAGILVGSTSPSVDRSRAAFQVLGTPTNSVYFTSYNDEAIGIDLTPSRTVPRAGDWGGVEFLNQTDRDEGRLDAEADGAFLNYINHADMRYGGGSVLTDSQERVIAPIQMVEARPTISFNSIRFSADAAMSANPDSFEETNFHAIDSLGVNYQSTLFQSDYQRVGPDIHDNIVTENSVNGLFIRVEGSVNGMLETMNVSGRWNDRDIVHYVGENLIVHGQAGGALLEAGTTTRAARLDARLAIDPGIVVKLDGTRIEADFSSQIIAEGTVDDRVIFTSTLDDRFGAGGTFDTTPRSSGTLRAGAWGGIFAGPTSSLSIDYAFVSYAGGITGIEGEFAGFNAIEIHQADARVAHTRFEANAEGVGGTVNSSTSDRAGRGPNTGAVIFVRGAQPVIIQNEFANSVVRSDDGGGTDNTAISINVNSLNHFYVRDLGRQVGLNDRFLGNPDNQGPLVRGNRYDQNLGAGNIFSGMFLRGEELTTESVWDDTDVTHLTRDQILIPDFHTFGGLRLESNSTESLVVKFGGPTAGFVSTGNRIENDDRIGGRIQIIGQPGVPVILTSFADDSVGAGFNLNGTSITDVSNNGDDVAPAPGDWSGIRLLDGSHDRNVEVITELESSTSAAPGTNANPVSAQPLGELARGEKAGDENRRLGFEIQGFLTPGDEDFYSFRGTSGTEIWLDLDRTGGWLDSVIDLVDATGNIIATSDSTYNEGVAPATLAAPGLPLIKSTNRSGDIYSTNVKDAGMRVILPGAAGSNNLYHVRVRMNADGKAATGTDRRVGGNYQLNVRLRDVDEISGSTIRLADIRYAVNAIHVSGQPAHSPLLGEIAETSLPNDLRAEAQNIGNVLRSDRGAVNLTGSLSGINDVDWFQFEVKHDFIGGYPHDVAPVIFDVDYADQLARPNVSLYLYDANGNLAFFSQDANTNDDLSAPATASGISDLSRGSLGTKDPFLGPISLRNGTYYLAVTSSANIPDVLRTLVAPDSTQTRQLTGALTIRTEPVTSVNRIVEDHVENQPKSIAERTQIPVLFDNDSFVQYTLGDIPLYVSSGAGSTTITQVDPFTGNQLTQNDVAVLGTFGYSVQDLAIRTSGTLHAYETLPPAMSTDGGTQQYKQFTLDNGTLTDEDLENLGLVTWYGAAVEMPPPDFEPMMSDSGFNVNAFTIVGNATNNGDSGFVVGNLGDLNPDLDPPAIDPFGSVFRENIVYRINPEDGTPDRHAGDRDDMSTVTMPRSTAGTQVVECGLISTTMEGAGTVITGIAPLGNFLYAVSNKGGLYRIPNPIIASPGQNIATFIGKVGNSNFAFTGLSAGPPAVEGGAYENLLFGIDAAGMLRSFDNRGALQSVFFNGANSLATGVTGAHGVAFGRVEPTYINQWHVTNVRAGDANHGITQPPDFTRQNSGSAGQSIRYGRDPAFTGIPGVPIDYNNLEGSKGTLMSAPFSLLGVEAADKPILSFNYFLATEDAAYSPSPNFMYDSLRVHAADSSGEWQLLATNNQFNDAARDPSGGLTDEYDYNFNTVELVDNTGDWLHARIDLSPFAGKENVRLRFDFSTSGTMSVGNIHDPMLPLLRTGGDELFAVDSNKIKDGDVFRIYRGGITDNPVNFEFDFGYTLAMPDGTRLADGQTLTITRNGTARTYEFDFDGNTVAVNTPVRISRLSSPETVANALATAILGTGSGVTGHVFKNGVNLEGTGTITVNVTNTPSIIIATEPNDIDPGNVRIPIHNNLPAYDPDNPDVVEVIVSALASQFTNNRTQVIKTQRDLIRLIGHAADPLNMGPIGLSRIGPGGNNGLPGDAFGNLGADPNPDLNPAPVDPPHRFFNNAHEGVYLDDFVIGFAARGEMVSPPDNSIPVGGETFVRDPQTLFSDFTDVTNGVYQVEIRSASDFTLASGSGVTSVSPPDLLFRSWDINERLIEGFSLDVPNGWQIVDGATFKLGNVTFEFDNLDGGNGVQSGRTSVPYRSNRTGSDIATDLVNIINNLANQGRLAVTADKVVNSARIDLHGDEAAVQRNVILKAESNDTLDTAVSSGIPLGSTGVFRGLGTIGDNFGEFPAYLSDDPPGIRRAGTRQGLDVDIVKFELLANQRLQVDIDAFENDYLYRFNAAFLPFLRIFDAAGTQLVSNFFASPPDENAYRTAGDAYIDFIAPSEGTYYVAVSNVGNRFYDPQLIFSGTASGQTGDYELMVTVGGATASPFEYHDRGDSNRFRDQGQLIIQSNTIQDSLEFGIRAEAGDRDTATNAPHPGTPQILRELNTQRLARGVVIQNNIIVGGGLGGIRFAGSDGTEPLGAVPFGRIVNNTLYGVSGDRNTGPDEGDDVGILVESNASPTILNNIIANFTDAITTDATSTTTVRGGNIYRDNSNNPFQQPGGLGSFDIDLDSPAQANKALFVNAAERNFYLAPGSSAIDSSIDQLQDRPAILTVLNPLGYLPSPILAPSRDITGQLRVDDPSVQSPFGSGQNVFKDRGALDRSDFSGPIAELIQPLDNDAEGIDLDPSATNVRLEGGPLNRFVINLTDVNSAGVNQGSGINDLTVTANAFSISRNGISLTLGVDYRFDYDATSNQVLLSPLTGLWSPGAYVLTVNNTLITDIAGNRLRGNQNDTSTRFTINLGAGFDFGDAPDPTFPTFLANDGARHRIEPGFFLGTTVTGEANGLPAASATLDSDDGVTFPSVMRRGRAIAMSVISGGVGFLDAWVDFNQDGDWLDAGEQIFVSQAVVAGTNVLTANFPATATSGNTYARFRLSHDGGLSPTGLADGGEVEDYRIFIAEPGTDFGDAPTPYPTTAAEDGAAHTILPGFFLGNDVLADSNGNPSANAAGDADDDGVTFNTLPIVNGSSSITVVASAPGRLDAWFDFNRDGDWADAGEQAFVGIQLNAGSNLLTLNTPGSALFGRTIARFRLSSTGGLSPTGVAIDGEVEDYAVDISPEVLPDTFDFGDAPASFPVTLAQDGARHILVPGVFLGSGVDADEDGQPSAAANLDTADDGVTFSGELLTGRIATVNVVASVTGRLDGWIDFNLDGDWNDPGENVFSSQLLVQGGNSLSVNVPALASVGNAAARFRFSTAGSLGVTNFAVDGEVEDYLVTIVDPARSWHNYDNPVDVNNRDGVSPLDALTVINELDAHRFSDPATGRLVSPATPPPFYDVNNDGFVSPLDALLVINALPSNSNRAASGISVNADDLHGQPTLGETFAAKPMEPAETEKRPSVQNSDLALRSFAVQSDSPASSISGHRRRDRVEIKALESIFADWE